MSKGVVSYIISKLQKLSTMKEVEQTQAVITKAGLLNQPSVAAKLISFSSLSPSGSLVHAQMIFEETDMDDPFIYNTLIRGYSRSVFPIKAIHLYNQMYHMNVEFDNFTYTSVLKACARVLFWMEKHVKCGVDCKGAEIHCRIVRIGFDDDHFIGNSLVYMYSQCGLLGPARRVFDEMTEKTVASWNIMISAYAQFNDFNSANCLFESMPRKNVVSWNTLISRYVRLGDIEAAKRVFQTMLVRDSVSWNSMIAGHIQIKDYVGALNLFREMQIDGVEATEITFISVLGACAETGALEIGRKIHEFLKEKHKNIEGYLGNALVDMYAKCGSLSWAWEVFNELKMRPVSCWNAMVVGLASHGLCEEALELFSAMEMRLDEVTPNRVTFIGVLIACRHKGFVEEGRRFFSCMINEYNITPDVKHYGCMVDLLCRTGFLEEAHQMIKTMPFKANCVLWRTLLGACKIHGNVELAEESFQELAKLEAPQDGDYVLLSNIYAEATRWNDVERVRNEMISWGVLKKPGASHL